MPYYRNLREHLQALEEKGKLRRIKKPINKDTELHPLARLQFRGLPEEERKAFLFEKVVDSTGRKYDIPVVVGALAGSADIYAIGMKCLPGEISKKMAEAELNPIPPKLVSQAPVQEEVHLGDTLLQHGGLAEFPIPVTTPGYDIATYITAPYWITKDPQTGVPNVGMYRAMVKSPTRTGINFSLPIQGALAHWQECQKRGIPMQAAIVVGGPPSVGYAAVTRFPHGVNELAVAGGIAGEPLPLVKCKTIELEVPAHAEIVIEGEIPVSELEFEAPFGEAMGFVGSKEMMPYLDVKCITHRKNPIWLATVSQYPPSESSKVRQFAMAATVYKHLRYEKDMSYVLGVEFYDPVGSSRLMFLKIAKTEPQNVWLALEAAQKRFTMAKIIIAVDEDVNTSDIDSVLLAVCMRTQPHRDYCIVKGLASNLMDYALEPAEELAKRRDATSHDMPEASVILINATMQWAYPPLSLPKKQFMDKARLLWKELGLPDLKLKEPWWGPNLGYWSEEEEQMASAVVKGEYYKAGETYAQRRRRV